MDRRFSSSSLWPIVGLISAACLPLLIFAAFSMYQSNIEHREEMEVRLRGIARGISVAVDRDVAHQLHVLGGMAQIAAVEFDNVAGLRERARRALALEGWRELAMTDAGGNKLLFETGSAAAGVPHWLGRGRDLRLPTPGTALMAGVVQRDGEEAAILLQAAVARDGELKGILWALASHQLFSSILAQQQLPPEWTIAVLDANMRIAGRTRQPERFVGQPATKSLADRIRAQESGMFLAQNQEGNSVYGVFHRSHTTGWSVAIGIPAELIDGPRRRALVLVGSAGIVLLLLAAVLAGVMGWAISRRHAAERELGDAREELAAIEKAELLAAKQKAEQETSATEQSLRAAEQQLAQAQKLEALGRLTGGVAHDFNNLLQVVLSSLEIVRDRPSLGNAERGFIELSLEAAQRGAKLTQQLLAFSRRQALTPVKLDVNELVRGIAGMLRRTIGEDIDLRLCLGDEPLLVKADRGQLEAALLNLAINARDSMTGGGQLAIEAHRVELDDDYAETHSEVRSGPYIRLSVSDSGHGIPHEIIDRIFEPFFTTKEVGKGSGLGLSMVHGFIKQSGGHISVYSEPGAGTNIALYLPEGTYGAELSADRVATAPASRGQGETILVVEDDPQLRQAVAAQLESLEYRVIRASSGKEALEILQTNAPDVILSDMVLPGGISGLRLAEMVSERNAGMPFLLMTGYSEEVIGDHPIARNRLLRKPFSKREIASKLRDVLSTPSSRGETG